MLMRQEANFYNVIRANHQNWSLRFSTKWTWAVTTPSRCHWWIGDSNDAFGYDV